MTSNRFHQVNDTGYCQCSECKRVFGGLSGFDAHRMDVVKDPYDWRCATDVELEAKAIHRSKRGWWVLDQEVETEVA